MNTTELSKKTQSVAALSLLLFFFTIPHTLEDFALGAPEDAGISASVLSTVIALIFSLQALGLYWLGQKQRKGFFIHIGLGLFWPIASGLAQLPIIFNGEPYRAGLLSKVYVFGMIVVALLMLFVSIKAVLKKS
jgi:hypothetical protein